MNKLPCSQSRGANLGSCWLRTTSAWVREGPFFSGGITGRRKEEEWDINSIICDWDWDRWLLKINGRFEGTERETALLAFCYCWLSSRPALLTLNCQLLKLIIPLITSTIYQVKTHALLQIGKWLTHFPLPSCHISSLFLLVSIYFRLIRTLNHRIPRDSSFS